MKQKKFVDRDLQAAEEAAWAEHLKKRRADGEAAPKGESAIDQFERASAAGHVSVSGLRPELSDDEKEKALVAGREATKKSIDQERLRESENPRAGRPRSYNYRSINFRIPASFAIDLVALYVIRDTKAAAVVWAALQKNQCNLPKPEQQFLGPVPVDGLTRTMRGIRNGEYPHVKSSPGILKMIIKSLPARVKSRLPE